MRWRGGIPLTPRGGIWWGPARSPEHGDGDGREGKKKQFSMKKSSQHIHHFFLLKLANFLQFAAHAILKKKLFGPSSSFNIEGSFGNIFFAYGPVSIQFYNIYSFKKVPKIGYTPHLVQKMGKNV